MSDERRPSYREDREFDGVTKRYGNGHAVLESMNLTIPKGEFVSIIGPSGCGKSTVLKLISGLTPPSAGTIRVDGMTPKNARETDFLHFSGCDAAALAHGATKCWSRHWNSKGVAQAIAAKRKLAACSSW